MESVPPNKEIEVLLPFYLEVLCRLEEPDVTGNKELDIEALRHSWEAARKQWEEISPVAEAFLAIGPAFTDQKLNQELNQKLNQALIQKLNAFCEAYQKALRLHKTVGAGRNEADVRPTCQP